jgi:hypothetical protein
MYVLDQTSSGLGRKHLDKGTEKLRVGDGHGVVVFVLVRIDKAQDRVCRHIAHLRASLADDFIKCLQHSVAHTSVGSLCASDKLSDQRIDTRCHDNERTQSLGSPAAQDLARRISKRFGKCSLELRQERLEEERNLLKQVVERKQDGGLELRRTLGDHTDERTGDLGNEWLESFGGSPVDEVRHGESSLSPLFGRAVHETLQEDWQDSVDTLGQREARQAMSSNTDLVERLSRRNDE